MLVLARGFNEKVIITTAAGERIEVKVVEIRPHKIKLGFSAAKTVVIDRDEIDELRQEERRRDRPQPPAA